MTDDSGVAAMSVSKKLLQLRQNCDRMGIEWHWRHKESSLEEKLAEAAIAGVVEDANKPVTVVTKPKEQRPIPQDVLDALDYCNGYHRGNTKCIRAYIDEIR